MGRDVAADFLIACIHCSGNCDLAGKIVSVRAKKSGKLAEIGDRRRDVPAKIGTKPIRQSRRERAFAAERELIFLLLYVKLLQLDLPIIERNAEHDEIGLTVAPRR